MGESYDVQRGKLMDAEFGVNVASEPDAVGDDRALKWVTPVRDTRPK